MKTEMHTLVVKSSRPPVVELDPDAGGVYIRFKTARVARTLARPSAHMHVAVDLDAKGEVIGIEGVGVEEFTISALLKQAAVQAPEVDFTRARFRPVADEYQSRHGVRVS